VVADLFVVGLDLVTGLEVHARDRRTEEWRKEGHNGDRTLVCQACYEGADLLNGPQIVPLVPKGREGGARRQHFAHPPGMAPPGGRHCPVPPAVHPLGLGALFLVVRMTRAV
jgi:hypothetical protein